MEWAEDDTFSDLEEGEKSYHVRLKVNHATFAGYSDDDFTIRVKVSKAKLDFSDVRFVNADRWIDVENEDFDVEGLPEGVNQEPLKIEYKLKSAGDEVWSENKPSDGEEAKYVVRVTFTYDNTKYQLVTDEKELLPPSEYTLDEGTEANTGTIIGDYTIAQLNMDNIVVETPSLTFNGTFQNPKGTPQNTIRLNGVPEQSKVTFSWGDSGEQVIDDTGTNPLVSGAAITDAGTYTIRVKVEKDKYQDFERDVEVTIAPQTLTTPTATTSPTYDPGKIQTGVPYDNDGRYTMEDNTGTDAGDYAAKATVYNKNNYVWSAGDTDKDGTVEIPWRILYKLLPKPTIQTGLETATYDGTAQTPVSVTSSDLVVSYAGDVLQAKYKDELAYTATNARETDANDYTVTVQLKNKNYKWSDQTDGDITLSWKIEPKQIKAPTVTVANKVYDGKPYNTDGAEITNLVHSDDSAGILELGADHTYYKGYAKLESAPTNAGNYAVEVDFDFVEGQKETNYQIVQNARQPFTITPAEATMTFTEGEETATYTAQGTPLQQVKVTNLVTVDVDKPASDVYTVTYTYKYRENDTTAWEDVRETITIEDPDTFVFTDVGQYQITAKWGAGTVSNNYTADPDTYTLTIKKAEDQSITLTPDKEERWTEAIDQTPAKYTITYGEAATFKVTGKAALDDASISYAVKDGSEKGPDGKNADVLDVDSTGKVTIKQAGTATITVTAAETANVGAASVEYTVTVNRAEPKLELNEGHAAYTGSEVAEDTYKKATLSGAGEGYAHPDGTKLAYYFYEYNANSQNTVLEDTENENALKTIPSSVGDYWLKVVFPGDACYSDAAAVAKFTITPAELSVSATGHTGTYDGKTHSAITIKSVTGNGTTLAQGQYTVKYAKTNTNIAPGADAGDDVWQDDLTVKDVADSSSDKLYYWYMVTADNYNPAIGKVEVKITPAPLTVTGEPASYEKEYDGDKEVDEALTDITVTAEDVPEVTIDVDATGTYVDKDAGTEKDVTLILSLTLSGTDGANIDWGNYSYGGKALTEGKITLTKAGAGTITPKAISVTGISAVDRVYDGTTKVQLTGTPGTTEGSFIGGDNVSFSAISDQTGTVTDAKAEDGKTVTVAAETLKGLLTGEDAKNYTVTQEYPTTVDITPRPVTLQFPNGNSSMTTSYDPNGLTSKPNVYKVSAVAPAEGTGFVSSDALADGDIQYTFEQDNKDVENPINVGEYTVTAELTDEAAEKWSNYTIEAITGTVEIIQATEELTVTVTEKTGLTYTGQGQDPIQSISVKGGNVTLSEDDGDYEVQFKLSEEGDYELDRDQLTAAVKDAKEYTVYWQVTTTNYGNKTDSFNVKVAPATLTLSSSLTKEKEYDGTTAAVVTEQKVTGAQNGENITVSSVSAAYDNANVGTGKTITITYTLSTEANLGNYKYNDKALAADTQMVSETVSDCSITQAPVTVTISDQTSVYDGEEPDVAQEKGTSEGDPKNWYVSEGTIYNSDNLGIALSIASGSKDAGTYAITGAASNKNYDVTFTGNWQGEGENKDHAGTYTITPRPIKVEIGDAEGFYGDAPVLDNVELVDDTEDGVSDAGLVDGEVLKNVLTGLKLATTANAQSDISDEDTLYTIYAKKGEAPIQAPTQLGNYNVTFTNEGTYTVKQRPITITIKDHSSVYGEKIDGGIADPDSGEDYTVAITGNATTGDAIVKGDNLEIKLTTEATADSPVDDYDITGSAAGEKVNNYAITWAGNGGARDDEQGQNGRYTIKPAQLDIAFTQGDQVTNGVSINITDSYNANPLVLKNASTDAEVSEADKSTLGITYSIGTAGGGTGDVSQIAEIDKTTGEVTILKTGTVRITATVTPQGNSNYTGQVTTWYELNIISGGQMTLMVTPKTNLAYTGEPQELIETPICSLDSAKIQYSLDNQDWKDTIPTGTNAGTYTVYVKATDPSGQYSDVTEHVMVTIAKATLEGSFAHDSYPHVLATDGNSYDSATANPLTITSKNYDAKPANYTYYSDNMRVASSANGTSTIVITGTAGQSATIRVTVPGDDNYNGKTFTYKLEISDDLSKIVYSVEDEEATYNGQPQTIEVNVSEPASGATVMYWNEEAKAYDLSEPPAYTDVKDGGYPIKFQITAPGYNTVTGEATLTIEPKKITETVIAGIAESYTYTGKEITFDDAISVHDEGVLLKQNTDYTVSYDQNTAVGIGSVTITGTGNYKESVTKNFTISPVDASDLTASLNRTFGYYGDSNTNNATVTVTHGSHTVTSDGSNTVSVAVTQFNGAAANNEATVSGQTVTFNQVGTYTIEVTVTGNHATNAPIKLTYALLPVEKGELVLEADNETSIVATYGDTVDGAITVTDANDTSMTENIDYSLTYTYTPFEGTAQDSKPYDSNVMSGTPAAGMYVVTATGQGGYVNSVGTFTFLILQRDLAKATLAVNDTDLVFNHDEKRPSVTVTVDGNAQPTKDTDYTVTYYNNVNASNAAKAVVTATGNNFTGSKTAEFTISPKPIAKCAVENIPAQFYTGEPVIPPVTITDGNYTLILGYDYTTACADKGPGAATVTITGIGNYTETTTKDFVIKSEGAPEPSERFDLVVTPSQWTWGDDLKDLALNVTFGTGNELDLGTEYTLEVNGQTFDGTTGKTKDDALTYIKGLKPGEYTITATGMDAYAGSTDTETVTIQKIQPTVTVTATPNSLSGGGKVTLTLKGEKLPNGTDLKNLLKVTAKNDSDVTLEDLHIQWPEDGSLTAELTLPNTNETYTFALSFAGNDCYESASSNAMVVVGQQTSGGGGGSDPGDQPADPDDTGVSDWLNTKDHLAYLAGYPGGTFGPDQNMTRAEAAQMFYNLLLEKDVEITVEFEDVPADAWYAKPVNTLASLGILSGVGNGRFDPERSITRAEFTVIAMKFANTSGGGVNIFSDVNEDDWFYSAVVDSTQYGWINGYPDGTFRPEATISRAEVTVIVNHMLGRAADRPYVIAHEEELNTFGDVNRGHWGYFHIAEATNAHEYHTEDGTESWTGLS